MRIKLIGNPRAGIEAKGRIGSCERYLRESGAEVSTFITEKRGDAEKWAKEAIVEGVDRIVVAGGDGTINEVINGVAGSSIPVGIIPLGVSNVLALELGIPLNTERASDIAFKGNVRPVPLGLSNGRYFFLMAGVGFDAEVVCRLNMRLKRYLGKLTYILAGIKVIFSYKPATIRIITDAGELLDGYSAVIGKSKFYGGKFTITSEAGIEKEELDLCLFQNGRRRDILRYVLGIIARKHLRFKDILYRKVRGLRITSEGRVPVQLDGDCFRELPINISIKQNAVRLIFPKENANI